MPRLSPLEAPAELDEIIALDRSNSFTSNFLTSNRYPTSTPMDFDNMEEKENHITQQVLHDQENWERRVAATVRLGKRTKLFRRRYEALAHAIHILPVDTPATWQDHDLLEKFGICSVLMSVHSEDHAIDAVVLAKFILKLELRPMFRAAFMLFTAHVRSKEDLTDRLDKIEGFVKEMETETERIPTSNKNVLYKDAVVRVALQLRAWSTGLRLHALVVQARRHQSQGSDGPEAMDVDEAEGELEDEDSADDEAEDEVCEEGEPEDEDCDDDADETGSDHSEEDDDPEQNTDMDIDPAQEPNDACKVTPQHQSIQNEKDNSEEDLDAELLALAGDDLPEDEPISQPYYQSLLDAGTITQDMFEEMMALVADVTPQDDADYRLYYESLLERGTINQNTFARLMEMSGMEPARNAPAREDSDPADDEERPDGDEMEQDEEYWADPDAEWAAMQERHRQIELEEYPYELGGRFNPEPEVYEIFITPAPQGMYDGEWLSSGRGRLP